MERERERVEEERGGGGGYHYYSGALIFLSMPL